MLRILDPPVFCSYFLTLFKSKLLCDKISKKYVFCKTSDTPLKNARRERVKLQEIFFFNIVREKKIAI